MSKLVPVLLSVLLIAGYDHMAIAQPNELAQPGKFVIVPAGHTPLNGGNLPVVFSAWRLNTETGDLQFCIYDSGGLLLGKSVTPESLKCVSETK